MSDSPPGASPGDLSLKPEITAPGGNIYSTLDGGRLWLHEQHLHGRLRLWRPVGPGAAVHRRPKPGGTDGPVRQALAQALLMSTAKPLTEESGLPLLPPEAGARAWPMPRKAVSAQSYLLSEGDQQRRQGQGRAGRRSGPDRSLPVQLQHLQSVPGGQDLRLWQRRADRVGGNHRRCGLYG